MTDRISANVSTVLNPFGPQWASSAEKAEAKSLGEQLQDALFGGKKPDQLDQPLSEYLARVWAQLSSYKRKFAMLAKDEESDYRLILASGPMVMIGQNGTIFFGFEFLLRFQNQLEVLVGALAHEVGHRPKRWKDYDRQEITTNEDLFQLCRYEETRADLFAGRALAEVEMSPEPLIDFLMKEETGPHPAYFPARMRAEAIRTGWTEQKSVSEIRKKHWRDLDRATAPKWHIGNA